LLENGKNASFHIKSPVKNFHGRAKGGGIVPCPLNTPLITGNAPAEYFFQLVFGAEAVESGDEKAGVRHVAVDGYLCSGRRRTAVDDKLRQRTATVAVRGPELSRRYERGPTLQLVQHRYTVRV